MTSLFDKHPTDIHLILNKRCSFFNLVPEAQVLGNFLYSFPVSSPAPADSVLCVAVPPAPTPQSLEWIWGHLRGSLLSLLFFSWDSCAGGTLQGSGSFVNDTTAIGRRGEGMWARPGCWIHEERGSERKGRLETIRLLEAPSSRRTEDLEPRNAKRGYKWTSENKRPEREIYTPRHLSWDIETSLRLGFPQLGFCHWVGW